MRDCWDRDRLSRPTFPQIAERLSEALESPHPVVSSTGSLCEIEDISNKMPQTQQKGNAALGNTAAWDEKMSINDERPSNRFDMRYTAEPQEMVKEPNIGDQGKCVIKMNVQLRDTMNTGTQRENSYLAPSSGTRGMQREHSYLAPSTSAANRNSLGVGDYVPADSVALDIEESVITYVNI